MYPSVIVRVSCGLLARKESDSDALDAKPRRCYRAGTDARTRTHAVGEPSPSDAAQRVFFFVDRFSQRAQRGDVPCRRSRFVFCHRP